MEVCQQYRMYWKVTIRWRFLAQLMIASPRN
jgi:hypothetical protein